MITFRIQRIINQNFSLDYFCNNSCEFFWFSTFSFCLTAHAKPSDQNTLLESKGLFGKGDSGNEISFKHKRPLSNCSLSAVLIQHFENKIRIFSTKFNKIKSEVEHPLKQPKNKKIFKSFAKQTFTNLKLIFSIFHISCHHNMCFSTLFVFCENFLFKKKQTRKFYINRMRWNEVDVKNKLHWLKINEIFKLEFRRLEIWRGFERVSVGRKAKFALNRLIYGRNS